MVSPFHLVLPTSPTDTTAIGSPIYHNSTFGITLVTEAVASGKPALMDVGPCLVSDLTDLYFPPAPSHSMKSSLQVDGGIISN